MKDNGGVLIDESGFWELMKQKIGDIHEQYHNEQERDEETNLASEEAKLKAQLAKLEKKTNDVKRKLENVEEARAVLKKLKAENAGISELAHFVEKT